MSEDVRELLGVLQSSNNQIRISLASAGSSVNAMSIQRLCTYLTLYHPRTIRAGLLRDKLTNRRGNNSISKDTTLPMISLLLFHKNSEVEALKGFLSESYNVHNEEISMMELRAGSSASASGATSGSENGTSKTDPSDVPEQSQQKLELLMARRDKASEDRANSFIRNFRSFNKLDEYNFDEDDYPVYPLTYAKAAKLFLSIHANLAKRASEGQSAIGAKLCFATHVYFIDCGVWTSDSMICHKMLDIFRSYGCATPKTVMVSRGAPMVSSSTSIHVGGQIRLFGQLPTTGIHAEKIYDAINSFASNLSTILTLGKQYIGSAGNVYAIVPEIKIAHEVKLRLDIDGLMWNVVIGDEGASASASASVAATLDSSKRTLYIITPSQTATGMYRVDHLAIMPYVRKGSSMVYVPMSNDMQRLLVGSCPVTINSAGYPLHISLLSHDALLGAAPQYGADNYGMPFEPNNCMQEYLENMSESEMTKNICLLAYHSVQPEEIFRRTTSFRKVMERARDEKMLDFIETPTKEYEITKLTRNGLMSSKTSIMPETATMISQWLITGYPAFVGFCIAALVERYRRDMPPLINGSKQELVRIATERNYTDPFMHQFDLINSYIAKYKLHIISRPELDVFASDYGASGEALGSTIGIINKLYHSGLSSNMDYGPVSDIENLKKILFELNPFNAHIATYKVTNDGEPYHVPSMPTSKFGLDSNDPYKQNGNLYIFYTESGTKSTIWSAGIHIHNIRFYASYTQ